MTNTQYAASTQPEAHVSDRLQQHFGRDDRYRLLNNLALPVDKPSPQIDHLVIHRAGFIVVQSKSSHSTSSPALNANFDMGTLEEVLHEHKAILLDPGLPGLEQLQHFQERQFNIIVTSPRSADLNRDWALPEAGANTIHVESLVDRVLELTDGDRATTPTFSLETPLFTVDEMNRMCDFFRPLQAGEGTGKQN